MMRHHDRWDLPKGHVDSGETEIQCALRELREETGIESCAIEVDKGFCHRQQYTIVSKSGLPREKELVVFLAELIQPVEIRVTEHIGFHWYPWQPPHQIQARTIDPLLAGLETHWSPAM